MTFQNIVQKVSQRTFTLKKWAKSFLNPKNYPKIWKNKVTRNNFNFLGGFRRNLNPRNYLKSIRIIIYKKYPFPCLILTLNCLESIIKPKKCKEILLKESQTRWPKITSKLIWKMTQNYDRPYKSKFYLKIIVKPKEFQNIVQWNIYDKNKLKSQNSSQKWLEIMKKLKELE